MAFIFFPEMRQTIFPSLRHFIFLNLKFSWQRVRSALRLSRLSRHNGVPTPLFHGPLDRLAFLRSEIVPITGSQTYQRCSVIGMLLYAGRPLHYGISACRFLRGSAPAPRPPPKSQLGNAVTIASFTERLSEPYCCSEDLPFVFKWSRC